MVVGDSYNECGECVEISLNDKHIAEFSEMLRCPVTVFSQQDIAEETEYMGMNQL